ncbi:tyrosine-type recombinase/integrase [Rhodococcus opacus]|nr:tyrosine-type recombinase/integrase [Rhodococcus opacus]
MAERGLAAATREAYGRMARGYLCFLESRGTVELDDADGGTVLEFLGSLSPRWAKTTLFWVVSNLRPFLTFINRADLIDAVNLAGVKRPHPIVPVLGDDDHRRIIAACTSGIVCVRDAAITLLALSTGLRACDIIALRLGDIDWQGQTISLVQQKKGNPLTVPLIDVLTSTLADYVVHERPETEDDHLFVRRVAPHVRLRDHASIHRVTATVFTAAEVTDVKGGTRLLRHNAASRMLRAATPLPTIAAVLGLASEESAKQYMNIDDERLLRCVLPVPQSARP